MGRKSFILAAIAVFITAAVFFLVPHKTKRITHPAIPSKKVHAQNKTPSLLARQKGERISYDIRVGNVRFGNAWFLNMGIVSVAGKPLCLMQVQTNIGGRFIDNEKIYSDPQTALPIRVERNIQNWFNKERIIEEYNQQTYTVAITKFERAGKIKSSLKKEAPIHNSILLPYTVRYMPNLTIGKTIIANLPTKRLAITLVAIETLNTPAGIFRAYHFSSNPKQIDIWISADERRLPIKVQDKSTLGYSMILREYGFISLPE